MDLNEIIDQLEKPLLQGAAEDDFQIIQKENRIALRKFVRQMEVGPRPCPFVGAGLSIPNGFPGWTEFLLGCAREVGIEENTQSLVNEGRYEEAAEELEIKLFKKVLMDRLVETYGDHKLPGDLKGAITDLPLIAHGPVFTTNYDRLLELAFEKSGRGFGPHDVHCGTNIDGFHKANNLNERTLIKIHGDYSSPHTRILTLSDYNRHYGASRSEWKLKPVPRKLMSLFSKRSLLFLGCSLEDDRTMDLLEYLADEDETQDHFGLLSFPASGAVLNRRRAFLRKRNIHALWYPSGCHVNIHAFLELTKDIFPLASAETSVKPSPGIKLNTHRYNDSLRNGKFSELHIDQIILSNFSEKSLIEGDYFPVTIEFEGKSNELLENFIFRGKKDKPHVFLIGDGGMGKTTAVWNMVNLLEKTQGYAPLYIELQEINDATSVSMKYNWILDSIVRNYSVKPISHPAVEDIQNMTKEISQSELKYVLLLDGLNEVSSNRNELDSALRDIESIENLQIVITSRYNLLETAEERFSRRYKTLVLTGVEEENIEKYLSKRKIGYPQHLRDSKLLKNPMLLCLYAGSEWEARRYRPESGEFYHEPGTNSEIFHNFLWAIKKRWNERHTTAKSLWARTEIEILFKFALPKLGFEMEKKGQFEISRREILSILESTLALLNDIEYLRENSILPDHVEEMKNKSPRKALADRIVNYVLTQQLVLVRSRSTPNGHLFSFVHQNFRDYFATQYFRVGLSKYVDQGVADLDFLADFIERPLSISLHRMIGDLEGEHRSPGAAPSNLDLVIESIRGMGDKQVGFLTHNIIRIFIESARDLSDFNFSRLPLEKVNLNGIRLGNGSSGASFTDVQIKENLLFSNGHTGGVIWVGSGYDQRTIGSASTDGTVRIWEQKRGECTMSVVAHPGGVSAIFASPGWKLVATAGNDKVISLWTLEDLSLNRESSLIGHKSPISALLINERGNTILSASLDGTIRIWDRNSTESAQILEQHSGPVLCLSFSPDQKELFSGGKDGTIKKWEISSGEFKEEIARLPYSITSLCSIDNDWLIAGLGNGKIVLISLASPAIESFDFQAHLGRTSSLNISNDRMRLISTGTDGRAKEWRIDSKILRNIVSENQINQLGKVLHIRTLKIPHSSVNYAVYQEDDSRLLTASDDFHIREWDLARNECVRVYRGIHSGINSICLSPDDGHLSISSKDGTLKQVNIALGQITRIFDGHEASVNASCFSPSGDFIASGSDDLTLIEWRSESGEIVQRFSGHKDAIFSVEHNGRKIRSASYNGEIIEWDIKSRGYEIQNGRKIAGSLLAAKSNQNDRFFSVHRDKLREWDSRRKELKTIYLDYPGLLVQGSDFSEADLSQLSAEKVWLLYSYGARISNTAKEVALEYSQGLLQRDEYTYDEAKILADPHSIDELGRELDAKYGLIIRDGFRTGDDLDIGRLVLEKHATGSITEKKKLLNYIKKTITEQLRFLSLSIYVFMERTDSFGYFGEQRVASSLCRLLQGVDATKELRQFHANEFRRGIVDFEKRYKAPSGDFYLDRIRNFKLSLFGLDFHSSEFDLLDELLKSLGTPFRVFFSFGENDIPEFIFGKAKINRKANQEWILIEKEFMRSPDQVISLSGPGFGETIIRKTANEQIFYNKWVEYFDSRDFELSFLFANDLSRIRDGFKRKCLEYAEVSSVDDLLSRKPEWIEVMNDFDFWFRMGGSIDKKSFEPPDYSLLSCFRLTESILDGLNILGNHWAPLDNDKQGIMSWMVQESKDKGKDYAQFLFYHYLSDNYFLDEDDDDYFLDRTLLCCCLAMAFIDNEGRVDFERLEDRIPAVYDQIIKVSTAAIHSIKVMLEDTVYFIGDEEKSFLQVTKLIGSRYQNTPFYTKPSELTRRKWFWQDVLKHAQSHSSTMDRINEFLGLQRIPIYRSLLESVRSTFDQYEQVEKILPDLKEYLVEDCKKKGVLRARDSEDSISQ